jgi:hypothetical protein
MKASRLMIAAAVAAAAAAVPAAAQDPYAYRSPGEQILQGVVDSLLGNRYNVSDRKAVRRCADASLAEAWDDFGPRRGGWKNRDWRRNPMRIASIDDVQRRPSGLRVRGEIDSGLLWAQGNGKRRNRGDLSFRCNVDYGGRVTNVRVERKR